MRSNQVNGAPGSIEDIEDSGIIWRRQSVGHEQIHIRSYDHEWAYDLDIEITNASGTAVFGNRYYVQTGHSRSLTDVIEAGTYDVTVTLDNTLRRSLRCLIDDSPAHTAVIEVGNGTVSLTTRHTR